MPGDGVGGSLPEDVLWQWRIWMLVRERIGTPSPSERLADACDTLRAVPESSALPDRLSLFGTTRLATDQLDVVTALAAHRDVHVWIPHPSPAMWSTLAGRATPALRANDDAALVVGNPLLVSSARDVRELQARLLARADRDVHHPAAPRPSTVLARVQSDVAQDRPPELAAEPDDSVWVHACHGPARQVEVLRECLLHAFSADPTLEPRDVLVMCPDVETYAPLIRATFGQAAIDPTVLPHPGHRLRVRLADRALRQTNPVLSVVATLLSLADGRVTASDVLDFAATAPVRRAFTFSDDDLERMRDWAGAAGARWGIGAPQRAAFGLGDFEQNTFKTAMDRLLLGVTADDSSDAWLSRALPLDDVDGNDIDLAGRFAELVDRLDVLLRDLQGPHDVDTWIRVLRRAIDLTVDVSPADAWQRASALRELSVVADNSDGAVLRLADVRSMLAGRLAGKPTRSNFRTGELTVCTMVPMRSVPHRVVALLGLDDDVFPRTGSVDGDDVLARQPCVGERDTRSEDRQLLLDAMMSAGEKLMLFYSGADPVSGAVKPPAIPLSELIDVVTLTTGRSPVRRHPLQPFDERNFDATEPFSHDVDALAGAVAKRRRSSVGVDDRGVGAALLDAPLPRRSGDVDLGDLAAFFANPTAGFLRQRLGFRIPDTDDDIDDALGVELNGLDAWGIGDRMLSALLTGTSVADFRAAEWRRGTLPPFGQGERELQSIEDGVAVLAGISREVHSGRPTTVDLTVELGGGRRLTGTVSGIHGYTIASTSYSRLAPKHRTRAWISLLALAAYTEPAPWQAVTTGRGGSRRPTWRSTLTPPDDPIEILRQLVDVRDRGLAEPIPLLHKVSERYADKRSRGDSSDSAFDDAGREWAGQFGDRTDAHVEWVYGSGAPFSVIGGPDAPPDEVAWHDERSRFGALARRVWEPLLDNERQGPS